MIVNTTPEYLDINADLAKLQSTWSPAGIT